VDAIVNAANLKMLSGNRLIAQFIVPPVPNYSKHAWLLKTSNLHAFINSCLHKELY